MPAAGYYFVNNKSGYTDKYIFLPFTGFYDGTELENTLTAGVYWSKSLYTGDPSQALYFYMNSGAVNWPVNYGRYRGYPVRPVRASKN